MHYLSLEDGRVSKQRSEFALRILYKERDDILSLLNYISLYQIAIIDSFWEGKIISEDEQSIILEIITENIAEPKRFDKNDIVNIERKFIRNESNVRPQEKAIVSLVAPFSWSNDIKVFDINYEKNNDDYWINLDPHQACSIAEELRPKVLKKIEYICRPSNYTQTIAGTPLLPENNICLRRQGQSIQDVEAPITFKKGSKDSGRGNSYESYIYERNGYKEEKKALENKLRAKNLPIHWKEWTSRRDYHINGQGYDTVYSNREILVTAFETYDILLTESEFNDGDPETTVTSDGDVGTFGCSNSTNNSRGACYPELANAEIRSPSGYGLLSQGRRIEQSVKIYNVCNLDDITQLKVKIRKIPRLLRGVDMLSTVFRYGPNVPYRPFPRRRAGESLDPYTVINAGTFSGNVNTINNQFHYWKCMEIDNETNTLVDSTTPLFFQLMNEMMYRAFYGSIDEIEIKTEDLVSQFLWEMIPYEFFSKPPPDPV